jgi:hypothetical protein
MPAITQKSALPAFDRRFYGWSAITVALIVLVGFARTYYLKGFFGTRTLAPFVHFHGLVMSAWVVLFFVQTRLIAAHRVALHRSLGILGCCLAAVVFVVAADVTLQAAHREVAAHSICDVLFDFRRRAIAMVAAIRRQNHGAVNSLRFHHQSTR